MPAGRPLKFDTVEELEARCNAYFNECDDKGRPYTITGLALALDTTRETLIDYENKKEYSYAINKAKQRCQWYAEQHLYTGKQVAGAIFNLKNNYGWKDTQTLQGDSANPITFQIVSYANNKDTLSLRTEELPTTYIEGRAEVQGSSDSQERGQDEDSIEQPDTQGTNQEGAVSVSVSDYGTGQEGLMGRPDNDAALPEGDNSKAE